MSGRTLNWNAAVLSLLVPGWGQFELGRVRAAGLFLGWALLSLVIVAYGPVIGVPNSWGWVDLGAATLVSAGNALLKESPRQVAA
jgi:hypothetical protein